MAKFIISLGLLAALVAIVQGWPSLYGEVSIDVSPGLELEITGSGQQASIYERSIPANYNCGGTGRFRWYCQTCTCYNGIPIQCDAKLCPRGIWNCDGTLIAQNRNGQNSYGGYGYRRINNQEFEFNVPPYASQNTLMRLLQQFNNGNGYDYAQLGNNEFHFMSRPASGQIRC